MLTQLDFAEHELYPDILKKIEKKDGAIFIHSENGVILKIEVVSENIIRFRYATEGSFSDDFSYAIDPDFSFPKCNYDLQENEQNVELITSTLVCKIEKEKLSVSLWNKNKELIHKDGKGFFWKKNKEYGGNTVNMGKEYQEGESFFGLGDKTTEQNLYGKTFRNWGSDTYGYEENTDPSYRNISFYYGLHQGMGYGIFFDNSFETRFDFAKGNPKAIFFSASGGEMNYYFIHGPKLLDVCQRYTLLTGRPEMPPLWALGYQQCKWSYHPEKKVREIGATMREHKIPCDAIYIDIDYMDGFRCFTWDKEKFPNPKKMIQDLKEDGFKTVVIIDPGIKIDDNYFVFKDGLKNNVFCKRPGGDYVIGKVWPDDCYFPDYTNPNVRKWWGNLFKEFMAELKIDGVWNDMNEPALFDVKSKTLPLDVRHDYDGHPCSHRKAHNIYGMQMARATYEGIKKINPKKRPLVITRSGYSGLQRFASVWTGDNLATWRHLWLANVQCQRLAISGVSFCGSDVGGFVYHPSPELFYRWIQLGVFHPFFRTHSSGDHGNQEPWSFGNEALELTRNAIELRYRLLPVMYTAFYQYYKKGTPMLKPLVFEEQENPKNAKRNNEFIVGNHILVCPVIEEEVKAQNVYLPKGNWYDYFSNTQLKGGKLHWVNVSKNNIPVLVREGAVVPHFPVMQYVGEKEIKTVELNIYYKNGTEKSDFYFDKGEGYEYENGKFRLSEFTIEGNDHSCIIRQKNEGNYVVSFNYKINLIGFPFKLENNNFYVDADFKEIKL